MYKVSLLPKYYIQENELRKRQYKLLRITLMVMCVLLAIYTLLILMHASKKNELIGLRRENRELLKNISELEYLTALNNDINTLYNRAKNAAGNNPDWDKLILSIGSTVPETVGIINIEFNCLGETKTGLIRGLAIDHDTVSDWLETLNGLSEISDVKCVFSTQSQENSDDFVQFEITMNLNTGSGYMVPRR